MKCPVSIVGMLCLITVASSAQVGSHGKRYPLPSDARIAVGQRVIDKSADDETADSCRTYRATSRQVRHYFRTYKVVEGEEYHSMYIWLPCSIEGTVTVQGKTYWWSVNPGNTMGTNWPDGKGKTLGGKYSDDPSEGESRKQ